MNIPLILNSDAYSISSNIFASPEAKEFSCYNLVNRKSPKDAWPTIAKDSRMVFYGINNALRTVFQSVSRSDVKEAQEFMSSAHSFGGALPFDVEMWNAVADIGYLPIQISAIPEGTTFFPGEAPIHVENTLPKFGELAGHIEARLLGMVSIGTATATMIRHYLEWVREQVRIDNQLLGFRTDNETIDKEARWAIHNFGDRGCSSTEESVLKGKAHLLSFWGSDSFGSCYEAWKEGAKRPIGTSILALAHRGILSYNKEVDAFQALSDATEGDNVRIASFVADCYNYGNAVDTILNMAYHNPDVIYVIRPDSGEMFDVISHVFLKCVERGQCKEVNGFKLPTNVRLIYGDSVTPEKWLETNNKLRQIGMLPTKWFICGIGGYLMTKANRDSLSSAYKLCLKGDNKPVVKLSETRGKLSVPYRTSLVRDFPNPVTVYQDDDFINLSPNGRLVKNFVYDGENTGYENFDVIQNRAITSFDELADWARLYPDFGLNRENLSSTVTKLQDEVFEEYRG